MFKREAKIIVKKILKTQITLPLIMAIYLETFIKFAIEISHKC